MGGLELQRFFMLISSRLGTPSVLVKRSFKFISGYIFVGKPEGKGLTDSVSLFSYGFELNNLIISESLVFWAEGELNPLGILISPTSAVDCWDFNFGVEDLTVGLTEDDREGPRIQLYLIE